MLGPKPPAFAWENGHNTSSILGDSEVTIIIRDIVPKSSISTKFELNEYVLRKYPSYKNVKSYPEKYGPYWRGHYIQIK